MESHGKCSRRSLLVTAAGLATVPLCGPPLAAGAVVSTDPRTSAEGQVKLNATLDGSVAYWPYSGIIYAVRPRARPLPLLAVSGCQANWAAHQPDGSFLLAAPLVTFFRDIDTGAFLEYFDNPFSGARNEVQPNLFVGKGYAVYPADGSAMRITGNIGAAESAPHGFKTANAQAGVGRVVWSLGRDTVVLTTDQFFDVATQPQAEAQTRTADRRAFFDPRVRQLPARFSATTISPWLRWMQMGEAEGHLVWHTSGEKVFSITALPADYRTRAGSLLDHLTTRPAL